jgi:tryptophan halogenase
MIKDLLVLGSGSAGLLAALAIRRKMPRVRVRIVRSPEIGTVGVGESTTPNVPVFIFNYLGIDRRKFFQIAEPTWKLGIHFFWGPRDCFEYPFMQQLDLRYPNLPRPNGYYCVNDFTAVNLHSALMLEGKAFARRKDGLPDIDGGHAFHLENAKFVKALEWFAVDRNIEFIDGTIQSAQKSEQGLSGVTLEDGRTLTADFFIDASGFRSELIGKALAEPFISFSKSLFNDRAILGSWDRSNEPILPYTTAETMDAGWSWRIDHEKTINRGYVYCSNHITDEQARSEFADKNPKAKISDRIVRFRTGRHERSWVGNVMAVGNAFGFVEPLEATALMMTCWQCQSFTDMVGDVGDTPSVRDLFNKLWSVAWDEIRDFLTLHFKVNTRLNTPYWNHCRAEADSPGLATILDFYQENGPTGFARYVLSNHETQFGIEGYLVQLVGNKVPYRNVHTPTDAEVQFVNHVRNQNRIMAKQGLTVAESLAIIRHPNWRWNAEQVPAAQHRHPVPMG